MKSGVPREGGNSLGRLLCPEKVASLGHESAGGGGGEQLAMLKASESLVRLVIWLDEDCE